MQSKRPLVLFATALLVVFGFLATADPLFAASKEKVLHSFNGLDGVDPSASLIFDAAGNLYGTAAGGGPSLANCYPDGGCGIVFELTPEPNGIWNEKVLHSFQHNRRDGHDPEADLIFDAAGNLYGTTFSGGFYGGGGCAHCGGTVFQLTPGAHGQWEQKLLHSFNPRGGGGPSPGARVIFDKTGNLYGTTFEGGARDLGTVFELMPAAGGGWTEKVLHNFTGRGVDGNAPYASLIFDAAGNLYGTTSRGGRHSAGTVFQLTPGADGKWTEKVLHSFNGWDGSQPFANLIFDAAGNLYGTTFSGGASGTGCEGQGCGTVFELAPAGNGKWKEKVLHSFNGTDGWQPRAGLIFDTAGNLYGTTGAGGAEGVGTVFEITP
jgi:uncharacterized repeat protein (TIGR03803 family)